MSRLFGRKPESRAVTSVPWNVGGPLVQTVSQSRALALTPVFAANRHLTDFCSTLPIKSYREVGSERIPTNLPRLFSDLKTEGRLIPWIGQAVSSLVLRGNAVGLKTTTDGFGYPTQITWVSMDRVAVDDSSGVGHWFIDGRSVSRLDIVHIPWIVLPGHTLGLSPIEHYAATINAGLGSQSYGNDWFNGGGFPPAVFKNSAKTVSPEEAATVRARLSAAMKRREPLVTGNDWDFTPITVPPDQAQFIETQKLSANQVAAIYGIEPEEIGGEAANGLEYSNEEMRQINRIANARPYLERFEEGFSACLPERQQVKFNTDAVIRADLKTRWEVYEIQRRIGARSVNDILAKEDESPISGGDVYVPAPVQQQPAAGERHLSAVPINERAHHE